MPRSGRIFLGDAPGRNRTCDLALRRRTLYPLSYRRWGRFYRPSGTRSDTLAAMRLHARTFTLEYLEPFVISRSADTSSQVVQVAIEHDGVVGFGEGAPDEHYGEGPAGARDWILEHVEPLLGDDPFATEAILGRLAQLPGQMAAKCAVDGALHDLTGKLCGQPLWRILGLDRTPPPTSYTICTRSRSPGPPTLILSALYEAARAARSAVPSSVSIEIV